MEWEDYAERMAALRGSNRIRTYRWLSKWMTLMGPYAAVTLRRSGRVMVWSPPNVIIRGSVNPDLENPFSFALVKGKRVRSALCPSSIC